MARPAPWGQIVLLASLLLNGCARQTPSSAPIRVGSKSFTESVVLGEILTRLIEQSGRAALHRRQLGGTQVLWHALTAGEIDLYVEYTGTIAEEVLSGTMVRDAQHMRELLAAQGVRMSQPLGFNNTYALGMREQLAERLGIRTISDLRGHTDLLLGFSNEFMDRQDGWPTLRERYELPQRARGLDHDLAYRALESGDIHVTDLYSTDAEIQYYGLRVLEDDRNYFPHYDAVLLYRVDLESRAAGVVRAIERLQGQIDESAMIRMNARAKLDRVSETRVAAEFLSERLGVEVTAAESAMPQLVQHTIEHLHLVSLSLGAAVVVAVPLGIVAARRPRIGQVILAITGIVQTVPSLALLVFMIPLLGIGSAPAIVALFLYSLLPIVRNTYAGLHDIPLSLRESAEALGLPPRARLRLIELPLASRSILAGIKTSAVINVGTATLGALIGAGGYGQLILTGIRLDDTGLILQGAVPAAALALIAQGLFELAERAVVPKGLRLKRQR